MPAWQVEGGAEAFARSFDKKIMRVFGAYPNVWAYDGYVARVRKLLGRRWIETGQFL
jgi:hypothetical protein